MRRDVLPLLPGEGTGDAREMYEHRCPRTEDGGRKPYSAGACAVGAIAGTGTAPRAATKSRPATSV